MCVSIGTLPLEPVIKDLSGRLVVNNNDNELFCSAQILKNKSAKHLTVLRRGWGLTMHRNYAMSLCVNKYGKERKMF